MKKVLSVILSLVMLLCVLPVSSFAAKDYTPATEYASYDANKVAANDAEYISGLSVDQIAGILLDYVDGILAGVDVNVSYEGFEINTLDMLDVDTLTKWAYDAISGDVLGGDFDKLDASALAGLSRKNGDVNYMFGMLQFMADNADLFGKVFSWDNEEQTFDCGKIGEYLETLNEGDEGYEARVFYEKYILSNNIQKAFTEEIAREMNYTIPEGETFDETISNGILAWLSGLLKNAGLLSDEGVAALKAFDLRTADVYSHLKSLVALLQSDNEVKERTYFTYYLDSLLRTVLKTALGFKPVVGEADASAAVVNEFKATYADLATLYTISGGTVNFRAADGSYYQFVVTAEGAIASAKALTWENALGFNLEMPVVDIFTGDDDSLVREYKPTSTNEEDYKPTIYTKAEYASAVPEEMKSLANVSSEAVPEEYANIIANGTAIPMKDYMKVLVKQGAEEKLNMTLSFAEIEAYAEQAATEMAKQAVSGVTLPFGLTVDVDSVDITLGYTGYATDDEFVCVVKADAKVNLSGSAAGLAQSTADDMVNKMLADPIATVVMDNLSGSDTDISALVALKDFIDTDFAVDMGVLDFAGNYEGYNGVIGQANRVLCDLLKMLLSDEGYESLGLTEGLNNNLTANLQKLCDKAGSIVSAAKNVISGDDFKALADSLNVSDLFASSHGFNADMLYNLDFSSVENLYVCAIRMGCDFLDTEEPGVLHDVHMLIENSTTLDDMAVKVADYVLSKAVATANTEIADFSYTYTSFAGEAVNDAATAKNVIMDKLVDIAYYAVNDWGFAKVNGILNSCIDKLNEKAGEALVPHVDFKFDVAKGADWEKTLNAMVDRVLDLTDGIIVCVASIDRNANVFDKIATVANAILPLGSLLSNCAGNGLAVDFENIINNIVFGDVLSGNFDSFLRLFETAEKTADVANGVSVTYALVKASDHIVDAVFPNTVEAELYTESLTVQQEFTGSLSDQGIAARNMRSINSVKADLVPAVLGLVRESGILPSLVKSDCEHTNTVSIDAIPATCITTGYTAGTRCKDCGKWLSGHEATTEGAIHAGPVVNVEAKEATCTEAGTTAGTKCSACGEIISGAETVAALGHDISVAVKDVAATCTEGGYTVYKCSRCDVTEKRDLTDSLGHDISVAVKTVAPTCTEQGYTVYKCSRCDATEKRDFVAAHGHTPVAVAGKAATCTEAGLTDGVKCSVCNAVITAQETIPATGHVDADGDNACDVCGATIKKPTFIDKIKAFFKKIIDWFKNLFK